MSDQPQSCKSAVFHRDLTRHLIPSISISLSVFISLSTKAELSRSLLWSLFFTDIRKNITYLCFTKTKSREFTDCWKSSSSQTLLCVCVCAALVNSRLWVMEGQVFQRIMQRNGLITITQSLHFLRRLMSPLHTHIDLYKTRFCRSQILNKWGNIFLCMHILAFSLGFF